MLRVMSLNHWFTAGDWRARRTEICAWINHLEPDVVCLQEVLASPDGSQNTAEWIAENAAGEWHVAYALRDVYQGAAKFGNAILSRWPILSTRLIPLPRTRTISPLNLQRGATEALIATPGGALRVYSVHLDHVLPTERIAQIRHLKDRLLGYPLEGGAITGAADFGLAEPPHPEDFVVMGDFNSTPWSRLQNEFRARTGLDNRGRLAFTWPSWAPGIFRLPIDQIFVKGEIVARNVRPGAPEGSDHLPILGDIYRKAQ